MIDNNGMHHKPKGEGGGQFTSSDGNGGTYKPSEAEKENLKARGIDLGGDKNKKAKSKGQFFGEEFKGYKGKEAIEKLLKEKRGHIKNAFERPEIGGIDLVWGDDSGGLGHTIMRRNAQLEAGTGKTSGIDMARKIPEIIEKGNFALGAGDRPNITYNDYLVVIKPAFDGEKVNWVLTAMEPQEKPQNKKV